MFRLSVLTGMVVLSSALPSLGQEPNTKGKALFRVFRPNVCSSGYCGPSTTVSVNDTAPIPEVAVLAPPPIAPSTPSVDLEAFKQEILAELRNELTNAKNELYAQMTQDPTFRGPPGADGQRGEDGRPGEDGLPGVMGMAGPKGDRGDPGQVTEDHINQIAEMVMTTLYAKMQDDPVFRGEDGRDAEPVDVDSIANAVFAKLQGSIPENEPSQQHYVLLVDPSSENYPNVSAYAREAQSAYQQFRVAEPPEDRNFGTLPQLVAYKDGVPVKRFQGQREVVDQLRRITNRGY